METIEQRIADFEQSVREIVLQFKQMNAVLVNNPHLNIGPHDAAVIELLGEMGPQMMRVVAERLGLAVNSVTPIVDSLEQRGLVQRQRSDSDRRVVNVLLSDEGMKAFEAINHIKFEFHKTMLQSLSSKEQETFLELFRKIAQANAHQSNVIESLVQEGSSS